MKNWKTTTLGVLIILSAVINSAIAWLKTGALPDLATLSAAFTGGGALLWARDPEKPPGGTGGTTPVIIMALCAAMGLSGCAWVNTHQQQLIDTALVIVKRATIVAANAVVAAASDAQDKDYKANFLDGIADGLRTQAGSIVTSDDVASIVTIWSPNDGGQWQNLASSLSAATSVALDSVGQTAAAQVAENIAAGLNESAATARTETVSVK